MLASQIYSSNLDPSTTTIITSGYASEADLGAGAIYVQGASSGPGAIQDAGGRYWQLAAGQPIRVEYFGAGQGGDDTGAFQAAINTVSHLNNGTGGAVYAQSPTGYRVTNLYTINSQHIVGGGNTPLTCTASTGVCILLIGDGALIDGFTITATASNNATIGVQLGNGESSQLQQVRNCSINQFSIGIAVVSGVLWNVHETAINNSSTYGIRIQDVANADAGDGTITSTTISNATGVGAAAINYRSGGGLKLTGGNKILGFQYGLQLVMDDSAATVDLLVNGTSIENQSYTGIFLGRGNVSGSFGTVTLTGNQIAGSPQGITCSAGCSNIVITGNAFNLCTFAIVLNNGADPVVIGDNTYVACTYTLGDNRSVPTSGNTSQVRWSKAFQSSSTSSWVTFCRVDITNYRAAKVEVIIEGVLQNISEICRVQRFILARGGANCYISGGDTMSVGAAIDLNVDCATSPGSAYFQVKMDPSTGGGPLDATFTILIDGKVTAFAPLM